MSLIKKFLDDVEAAKNNNLTRKTQINTYVHLLMESLNELFNCKFLKTHRNTYEWDGFEYELIIDPIASNIGQFKFFYDKKTKLIIHSDFYDNIQFLKQGGIVLRNNTNKYVRITFNESDELIIQSFVHGSSDDKQPLTKENLMKSLTDLFNTATTK